MYGFPGDEKAGQWNCLPSYTLSLHAYVYTLKNAT